LCAIDPAGGAALKVLVVDDEPLARERLKRLLSENPQCTVVGEGANGRAALALNARLVPDVILMDIRMPEMDGLAAAEQLTAGANPPAIIFCTAYDDYAIEAFERRAVGYLLKPVSREKLTAALSSARRVSRAQMADLASEADGRRAFLQASGAQGMRVIALDELRLLMADQKYVTAYHPNGSLLLDQSLKELEERYRPALLRIHRNALVVAQHLTGLQKHADGSTVALLAGIERRPQVSRRHLAEVKEFLANL
jgi:two-component system response regulator AlgR